MSLKTWKAEFYPVKAAEAAKGGAVAAVEHSLRKWEGLRRKNLVKHEMRRDCSAIVGCNGHPLYIFSDTCALCLNYFDNGNDAGSCIQCPLSIVRGDVACDVKMKGETASPYWGWCRNGNAEPMIRWLKKALRWAKTQDAATQMPPARRPDVG